ncbi:MAG: hypothetical protein U0175_24605 [Caldilineaceae bacterium]
MSIDQQGGKMVLCFELANMQFLFWFSYPNANVIIFLRDVSVWQCKSCGTLCIENCMDRTFQPNTLFTGVANALLIRWLTKQIQSGEPIARP